MDVTMGRLEIGVATLSSHPNCQSKVHGNNTHHVIIGHVISGDAQTIRPVDNNYVYTKELVNYLT